MTAFLKELLGIAVLVFSTSTMLSVGLGHTLHHVFGPMRDARAVLRALLANFVLVPLLAYGIVRALPLDPSYESGLMLIATAAGAPFLMRLTQAASGNMPLSASLTMLLVPATVLYMPFAIPLVVPEAKVNPAAIALPLISTMLLPIGAGMFIRWWHDELALRLRPWLNKLSEAALVVLIASTVLANLGGIRQIIVEGAILAPIALILGAVVIGYSLGREYRGGHVVLGLGTGQRNIAAAMVVATQGLGDSNTVVMVVVTSLVELAILFPIAWFIARRRTGKEQPPRGRSVRA
jgi:bile acid:Na+ symporter, BASS family